MSDTFFVVDTFLVVATSPTSVCERSPAEGFSTSIEELETATPARYPGGMSDVTQILAQIEQGDAAAADQLLPLVYEELRRLAASKLAHEKPGQTLQATALVHEAYLRLVDVSEAQRWDSRGHFFSAAAEAMRRILVEMARRKKRAKHGGDLRRVDLDAACTLSDAPSDDIIALDEALDRFCAVEPGKAELVKLRFFAGMTIPEAAKALGISHATAERHWTYARVWLYCELHEDSMAEEESKKIVGQ